MSRSGRLQTRHLASFIACVALAAIVPAAATTTSAIAAPVIVTVTSNADDGTAGTLRWAIDQANAAPAADPVTIELPAGTYDLAACSATTDDANTTGDLDARPAASLNIVGLDAGATIRQTCPGERVLDVLPIAAAPAGSAQPAALTNVTVTGGTAQGDGGGIRARGDITLTDTVLLGNLASVPDAPPDQPGADARGGGLSAAGTATVVRGRVENNRSAGGGAGPSTTTTYLPAGVGIGGGIHAPTVSLDGVVVTSNSTAGGAGAMNALGVGIGFGAAGRGGGVAGDTVTITNSTLTANRADGGPLATLAEGGAAWAIDLAVTGSTLQSNSAVGAGGGSLYCGLGGGTGRGGALAGTTITVEDSAFDANAVTGGFGGDGNIQACWPGTGGEAQGGAIHGAAVVITASSFHANNATGGRGGSTTGCPCTSGASGGRGIAGAVFATASVSIGGSQLHDDLVTGGRNGGTLFFGLVTYAQGEANEVWSGGAVSLASTAVTRTVGSTGAGRSTVHAAGAVDLDRTTISGSPVLLVRSDVSVTALSSTFDITASGPSGFSSDRPHVISAPAVTLTHVTALDVIGGASSQPSIDAGTLESRASLLASSNGQFVCTGRAGSASLPSTTSGGANVVRDATGSCGLTAPSDLSSDDASIADLSALADHGAPTPTRLPLSSNPAIDRDAPPCALGTDQHGTARPIGPGCDAGAVEVATSTDLRISSAVTPIGSVAPGAALTWDLSITNDGPNPTAGAVVRADLTSSVTGAVATASDGGACFGTTGVVSCTWPSPFPVSGTRTVTIGAMAPVDGTTALVVRAWAGDEGRDPNSGNNTATTTTTIDASADLAVAIGPIQELIVGLKRQVVVTVTNNGPTGSAATTASPLPLTVDLPSSATVLAPPAGCSFAAPVLSCERTQPLLAAQSWSVYLDLYTATPFAGESLAATIGSRITPDPSTADDTAAVGVSARAPHADLSVALVLNGSLIRGQTATLNLTVANAGPDPMAAPNPVRLQLPAGFRVSSFSSTNCSAPPGDGVEVTCTIASTKGASWGGPSTFWFQVRAAADAPSPATFTANVTAPILPGETSPSALDDPDLTNNTAIVIAPVRSIAADLAVTSMSANAACDQCPAGTIYAGYQSYVRVGVVNNGIDPANTVSVDVTGPSGVTVTGPASTCTAIPDGVRCPASTVLAANGTVNVGVFVTAGAGLDTPLTLHARVTSLTLDEVPTNNELDVAFPYVSDATADAEPSLAYLPGTGGVGALVVKLKNHGPNLTPIEPFTIWLSSTFTSAVAWTHTGLGCANGVPAAGGGIMVSCTPVSPGAPSQVMSATLFAAHGANPAEIVAVISPSNDPNPANNVAVWSSDPQPSISGTVTEAGTTDVLPGITVSLLSAHPAWTVVATTTTDALGHYRFSGVPNGTYEIRFFDPTGTFERRWWMAASTYRSGTPITVAAGSSSPANQPLAPAPAGGISGRAQTKAAAGLAGISVLLFDAADGFVRATTTGADGYYQFDAVPAGSYYVQFVDPTHTYLSRWSGDVLRFDMAAIVTVGSDVTWASVILR